ncbi:MAG TPA: DNA polymerase III subunit alpha, partial [Chloroflexota bacterium]|nr:DNA polymerase III subunit alpha [Chloroflexota bacterium]
MAAPEFTHLHCHTEYSLLDGLARVDPLMDAAVAQGMTSIALTDHGVMFGAIEFYKAAKDRGIKPIVGIEAYVAPRSMEQREGKQDAGGHHLVLLAENEAGYRNLLTLASEAQLRGFYYKPRIDKDLLARHSDGLIALSACLSSEVARHLLREDVAAAEKAARWYADVFPGAFYLELQDHGLPQQQTVNGHIVAMAGRLGLPLVVTNDVHYINRDHAWAQEVLLCIQTGTTVDDPKRMKMDSQEFYLKSPREMWDHFGDYPQALKNTMAIAERCNLQLEFGRVQLPEMPVPEGHTLDAYLAEVCHRRLAERYSEVTPAMRERLDYELAVIKKTGFAAYFLLLDDIIGFARREGIMVGPGRGSAVGSLASYCLGITNVEPLGLDLLFERFLNPDRLSMPDIDTD